MYVAPTQINFVVPAGTAAGTAQFSISNGGASPLTTTAIIQSVAPTLFSINGNGKGVASAYGIRTAAGVQTLVPVYECTGSTCAATPIALDANSPVVLVLYGTGIRNRSSLANVTANINGTNVPVLYAGVQPSYAGLDQVNLTLPVSLSGSGVVNLVMTVDGQTSNVVTIDIQ